MGFTKDEIVKIYKIFNRVVDCQGNLKVFRDAWDSIEDEVVIYVENNGAKNKPKAFDQQKLDGANKIYSSKAAQYYNSPK